MLTIKRITIKNGRVLHLKIAKNFRCSEDINERVSKLCAKYELGAIHIEDNNTDSLEVEVKKLKKEIKEYKHKSLLFTDIGRLKKRQIIKMWREARK